MTARPVITTSRLVLRPFADADAAEVERLAGDERVSCEIPMIPYPYPEGLAGSWIGTHEASESRRVEVTRAITLKDTGSLVGCISLARAGYDHCAELGYWIGVEFWGHGYVTEAAKAFVAWAFEHTWIWRVQSHHAVRNPRSGRIMQKIGMRRESVSRGRLFLEGELHDVVNYGLLRDDLPLEASLDLHLASFPLVTGQLELRPVEVNDAKALHRLFNSPDVYEGLASLPKTRDLFFSRDRVTKMCSRVMDAEAMHLIACLDGHVIGEIGIGLQWRHRSGGLGYILDADFRGKGYASEMLQAMVDYAFDTLNLHRVWTEILLDNAASIQLVERNGFSHEGLRRGAYLKEGRYLDADCWSMVATDVRPWKE